MADGNNVLSSFVSFSTVLHIMIYLICIGVSWWALQEFRFDVLLKRPKSAPAIMLQILLSIALGQLVASFFIQYLGLSIGFGNMF
ncbi:DUF1146 family protein [Paenibacillus hexagrammi]|uniref:DUF1146 family protein n=1 Tax=Paenibacillus hexagrammi TaxID=2908839 RepID=A0ABY3SJ57_9BACL|nr:DUF1146 family protein [Paenibacillus sp. YPD9-1]UJF33264.1 DUF1146 family protein [Paenibacillus sp. YPD9-1]